MDKVSLNFLGLANIKGVGVKTLNKIPFECINAIRDAKDMLSFIGSEAFPLKKHKRFSTLTIDDVLSAYSRAEMILEDCRRYNVTFISRYDDKLYPLQFLRLEDYPPYIFVKGNISCLKDDSVAVIGTREPSDVAKKWGVRLAEVLTAEGFDIVSGLAIGCDTCGHRGSLNAGGKTIAVLPCSLEKVYPTANKELLNEILEHNGCAISEYPIGSEMNKAAFVARDRLQAGLSLGVAVIETGIKGGTWHAVNTAFKCKMPVGFLHYDEAHYKNYSSSYGNYIGITERGGKPLKDTLSIRNFINDCRSLKPAAQPEPFPEYEQVNLFE